MRKLVACAVIGMMAMHCASASSPAGVVSEFYAMHVSSRPPGLPGGDELAKLRPLLSGSLEALIDGANAYQEEYSKRHPGEKPPFVDGDHFTSLFEGPTSFEVVGVDGMNVKVRFRNEQTEWVDTVVVIEENGRWVIDDVLFAGIGEFNPPGRLSEALRARDE